MKLSKRLSAIKEMVPQGSVVADVGSDHGKLLISLSQDKIILKGYGIENKKAPFNRLSKAISDEGLLEVTPLFSDGISELPSDVNTVVIAGMGGFLIVDILKSHSESLKNVKTIIVDAHNSVDKVREAIVSLGYFIKDEKMILEDDIYYEIIRFDIGRGEPLDELDISFGPILRKEKSPMFVQKYQNEIFELNNLLSIDNLPENRRNELEAQKERLEALL